MTEEDRRVKAEELLCEAYAKENMTVILEGGGFFCRRDSMAVEAIMKVLEETDIAEVTISR